MPRGLLEKHLIQNIKKVGNMIDKDVLLKTDIYKDIYQKEKDYIQELFLSEICENASELIFKGGTAISKFYGSTRFSDDLDFSIAGAQDKRTTLSATLDNVIAELSNEYPIKLMRKKNNENMLVYELSIRGPLFEMLNKYQHLKIEVDKNASTVSRTKVFRRDPIYPDLKPYVATVMSEKEILAEKVVALLFRHNIKARDLYDIYFLLQSGIGIEVSLVDKKMREYGHTFSIDRLSERMKSVGRIWDKELRRLLPEDKFVEYKNVAEYVNGHFKGVGLI